MWRSMPDYYVAGSTCGQLIITNKTKIILLYSHLSFASFCFWVIFLNKKKYLDATV